MGSTDEGFEELLFWRSWRAPQLIHMQPSGNTRYSPVNAWTREDEPRTQELLESLSRRFTALLEIYLDKVAGETYVRLAKGEERIQVAAQSAAASEPRTIEELVKRAPITPFDKFVGSRMIKARASKRTKFLPLDKVLAIATEIDRDGRFRLSKHLEEKARKGLSSRNQKNPTKAIKTWKEAAESKCFVYDKVPLSTAVRRRFSRAQSNYQNWRHRAS